MRTGVPSLPTPLLALWLLCTGLCHFEGALGRRSGKGSVFSGVSASQEGVAGLPTVAESERRLPLSMLEGKKHLVSLLPERATVQFLAPEVCSVLRALASILTGDKSTDLTGQRVQLVDIEAVGGSSPSLPSSAGVLITGFLSIGDFEVSVLVQLENGGAVYGLDFFVSSEDTSPHSTEVAQAFEAEFSAVRRALGGSDAAAMAEERGWAVPSHVASVAGVSSVTTVDGVTVHSRVFLFKPYVGSLAYVLRSLRSMPLKAKEYIAWRLVMIVLWLQKARIAHNDLKFGNFFMREDGSFDLGNFEGSAFFGEGITTKFFQADPAFAEPGLMLAVYKDRTSVSDEGKALIGSPAGDMWSLGMMLFSIFTGGLVAYGLTASPENDFDSYTALTQLLGRDARPDELQITLKAFEVPERWAALISKLLILDSRNRLTAEQLLASFPDLVHVSSSK